MIDLTGSKMNRFSYGRWVSYFAENDRHRLKIDLSAEKELTEAEKKLIFPSIRAFQKGEGSDGAYLMRAVDVYVAHSGEKEYRDAMKWFVREENWHSAYLKRYMDFHGVKPLKHSFLDGIFRRLRRSGGLKCEIIILVTAEMIALTYYDALAKCTDSQALRKICGQMLHDELAHIMFQSHTLRRLNCSGMDVFLRIVVMEAAALAVWCRFHRVFMAGGCSFSYFMRENLGYLRQSVLTVKSLDTLS